MSVRHLVPTLLLAGALAGPALAQPIPHLVESTTRAGDPLSGFLMGLGSLDDTSISGSKLQSALRAANVPQDDPGAAFLNRIIHLTKRGDQVDIRARPGRLRVGDNAVELASRVRITVSPQRGGGVQLTNFQGVKMATSLRGNAYSLNWARLSPASDGGTDATLNAGPRFFARTMTVHLPPSNRSERQPERRPGSESNRGLVGVLDDGFTPPAVEADVHVESRNVEVRMRLEVDLLKARRCQNHCSR